ncbi:MAG: prephenate dehydratase [Actinobacteria bacterium]|nr:prephenate dehydratase [Thermoleophilia bacterium]MCB9011105.1 prephenate dehydratase [Actinomycetota bacterium]
MKVGYLGPPGTFAEEALLRLFGSAADIEHVPYATVAECFEAVASGEVTDALVPIENSIEGAVNTTLDQLAFGPRGLLIRAEVIHPVRQHLIARPGVGLSDVTAVITHPMAPPQCSRFLRRNLPDVEVQAANSTAEAVRIVAQGDDSRAAIGPLRAADIYGGEVLAADIQDNDRNSTRFILIGTEPAEGTTGPGLFRTSLVCTLTRDRPGALLAILQEFAMRAVNLSRLESRPTKQGIGRYMFFIDADGSQQRDLPVSAAIRAIEDQDLARVISLGSYPVASTG